MRSAYRKPLAFALGVMLATMFVMPAIGIATGGGVVQPLQFLSTDGYEWDDTTSTAFPAQHGGAIYDVDCASCHGVGYSALNTSYRTFHATGTAGGPDIDSDDYVKISAETTDQAFMFETQYVSGWYDSYLYVEEPDGTVIGSNDDTDVWGDSYDSTIYWTAPAPGDYYVDVYNNSGQGCAYDLHLTYGNARRIAGMNRYDTSAQVSRTIYSNTGNPDYGVDYGPENIIVASGENPADALSGVSLAAQLDGVLLLTKGSSLSQETATELDRLCESYFWADADTITVWVLGGSGAVSDSVLESIGQVEGVYDVKRISGATRYETATEIADVMDAAIGVGTVAYVTNAMSWPDALCAGPAAAFNNAPVLGTMATDVPAATADWIEANGITQIYVIGGTGVVSDAVVTELEGLSTSPTVTRVAGADRYETSRLVADHMHDDIGGLNEEIANVVSGETFADALSAGVMCWWTESPLLLTKGSSLNAQIADFFDDRKGVAPGCYVVGGSGVVSEDTYNTFRNWWKEND